MPDQHGRWYNYWGQLKTLPTLSGQSKTLANNCLPRLDAPRAHRLHSGNADPCADLLSDLTGSPDAFANPSADPHPNPDPYIYAYSYTYTYSDAFTNPNADPHANPDSYIYAYSDPHPHSYVHAYSNTHPDTHVGTTPLAYAHRNSTTGCARDVDQSCPGRIHGP